MGAIAAFKGGWFDRGAFLASLFLSSIPPYCLAIILLFVFAVQLGILPVGGAYSFGLSPEFSLAFFGDAITYFWLPFWSHRAGVHRRPGRRHAVDGDLRERLRLRQLRSRTGPEGHHPVRYIFRNAMLPQITGLALAISGMIAGALIIELVFSYPGLGTLLFSAIGTERLPGDPGDRAASSRLAVLLANFVVDLTYGFIDPRIRAAQSGDR